MRQGLPPDIAGIFGILIAFVCVILAIALVIAIFYLLTLQKALSRVSPHNRKMEPGMVWLSLIPCVNIVWQFFIAIQVPDSLKAEFQERGRDDGSDYGKSIALTNCILAIVGAVISNGLSVSKELATVGTAVSGISGLIQLILFIVFWVKIANYSAMLAADPGDQYRDRRLDAFDDDDGYGGSGGAKGESGGPSEGIKPGDPDYR